MTLTHSSDTNPRAEVADTMDREATIKAFKARLLRARQAKNWNQNDLAKAAGLGKDIISQYSKGKALPREDSVLKLATALGVKPSDLLPDLDDAVYFGTDPNAQTSPFEMRVLPGTPSQAVLRVNHVVPTGLAIKIINMLQEDAERTIPGSVAN